ncbi:uncharacterized protein LAJ45_03550 [Morchella importuna]|uniref:uncharacterized protein n=1 Tax=Morchella importuna TaxID=1174673 RepID=UPI001E8ED6AC|nr:uncharacterized protein LAJ45_03550 [Morchella importuna]KAH8152124.1 hypothetical protein LAJ45_03550 [Morchella importuna]
MGLEDKSPATDDLLQHIASTFHTQDPGLNPAKAIISLLLGLSTQIEKLTTEVHTLSARHTADVTLLNSRINNCTPQHSPAPAPQTRPPPQRQPTHQPRQLSRPAPAIPPPQGSVTEEAEPYLNDPIETIDQNGNRRLLTYAEKLKQHQNNSRPAAPSPATRNAGPRKPTAPQPATNLPTAQRRFFATRSNPAPFPNHQQLEARLPSDLGRVLANAGLTHPHTALQVQTSLPTSPVS